MTRVDLVELGLIPIVWRDDMPRDAQWWAARRSVVDFVTAPLTGGSSGGGRGSETHEGVR